MILAQGQMQAGPRTAYAGMIEPALDAILAPELRAFTAGTGHGAYILGFDDDGIMSGHGMNLEPRTDEFYLSFGHGDLLFYPTAL
jgi:hypothetical protein